MNTVGERQRGPTSDDDAREWPDTFIMGRHEQRYQFTPVSENKMRKRPLLVHAHVAMEEVDAAAVQRHHRLEIAKRANARLVSGVGPCRRQWPFDEPRLLNTVDMIFGRIVHQRHQCRRVTLHLYHDAGRDRHCQRRDGCDGEPATPSCAG